MALLGSILFSALLEVATTVHGQGQAAAGLLADLKSPAGRVRVPDENPWRPMCSVLKNSKM